MTRFIELIKVKVVVLCGPSCQDSRFRQWQSRCQRTVPCAMPTLSPLTIHQVSLVLKSCSSRPVRHKLHIIYTHPASTQPPSSRCTHLTVASCTFRASLSLTGSAVRIYPQSAPSPQPSHSTPPSGHRHNLKPRQLAKVFSSSTTPPANASLSPLSLLIHTVVTFH